ncbi:MAG: hypothetical protein DMG50_01095 [Acidobacteria bacterium]|nr:MAG: hypothetical protein DMG50_01095 [Acidobacteriota bacterium]
MTADFFAATHSPKVLIVQEFGAQQLPFALRNPSVPNRMLYPTRKCILGLNGPRIEVGAVQEIAVSI